MKQSIFSKMIRVIALLSIFVLSVSAANYGRSDSRIVGGSTASVNQFPYMASLRFRHTNDHMCGGSIINERCGKFNFLNFILSNIIKRIV